MSREICSLSSPHHRPDDLHDRPFFLLIRSFQQFFYLFGLDPARLKVSEFEQILDFNLKCMGDAFYGFEGGGHCVHIL